MSESNSVLDELTELSKKINSYRPPAGIVMSSQVKGILERNAKQTEIDHLFGDILPKTTLGSINIYPFDDVPNDASIVFYDRKKLIEYLELREEGKSHEKALGMVIINNKGITKEDIGWGRGIIENHE